MRHLNPALSLVRSLCAIAVVTAAAPAWAGTTQYDCALTQINRTGAPIARPERSEVSLRKSWLGGAHIDVQLWGRDSSSDPVSIQIDQMTRVSPDDDEPGAAPAREITVFGGGGGLFIPRVRSQYRIDVSLLQGEQSGRIRIQKTEESVSSNSKTQFILDCVQTESN
jgi:hypothetical protein